MLVVLTVARLNAFAIMQLTGPVLRAFICLALLGAVAFPQSTTQSTFRELAQAAAAERESGHTQESIRDYQRAVELNPGWTEGWWYLGTLHYDARRFAEARPNFERVTRQLPSMGSAWSFLGLCDFELKDYSAAREHLEKGISLGSTDDPQLEKVARYHLTLLRTAIATGTVDAGTWRDAMAAYSAGAYTRAAALLKSWLGANPNDGTAWAVLGLSDFECKDYDNALLHLEHGRELGFGGSADAVQLANYRLGVLLNHAGQFEKAGSVLNAPSTSAALSEQIQIALGMSLLRINLFPQELNARILPTVQLAGATAGMLHASDYDRAFANFETMLKQQPALPFLHYAYGTALIALSRYDEAQAQMLQELRISPRSELPLLRLASIAIRRHRPADATNFATQALALAPNSGEAHYLQGRAALEAGQVDNAVRELEAANNISPNSPEIHFNLAKAYARAKNPEKAEHERAIFVRLNAVAEREKSQSGPQSYEGPREASDLHTGGAETAPPR